MISLLCNCSLWVGWWSLHRVEQAFDAFSERMLDEASEPLLRLQIRRILRRCTISRVDGLQFEFAIRQW